MAEEIIITEKNIDPPGDDFSGLALANRELAVVENSPGQRLRQRFSGKIEKEKVAEVGEDGEKKYKPGFDGLVEEAEDFKKGFQQANPLAFTFEPTWIPGKLSQAEEESDFRVAGTVAGAIAAFPTSGIAGIGGLVFGGKEGRAAQALKNIDYVGSIPSVLLETEEEHKAVEIITIPFEKLRKFSRLAGDKVVAWTGSPELGATTATTIEAGVLLLMPKVAKRAGGKAVKGLKEAFEVGDWAEIKRSLKEITPEDVANAKKVIKDQTALERTNEQLKDIIGDEAKYGETTVEATEMPPEPPKAEMSTKGRVEGKAASVDAPPFWESEARVTHFSKEARSKTLIDYFQEGVNQRTPSFWNKDSSLKHFLGKQGDVTLGDFINKFGEEALRPYFAELEIYWKKTQKGEQLPDALKAPEVNPERLARVKKITGFDVEPLVEISNKSSNVTNAFLENLGEPIPGKAININFGRINSPESIKSVIAQTARLYEGQMQKARRGTVTHAETERLAALSGVTTETLLQRRVGVAYNPHQATAARHILVSSADRLTALAAEVKTSRLPEVEFEFRKQLAVHYAIQSQVVGLAAEAGRTLNAFKIQAKSSKARLSAIDDMMKAMAERGEKGGVEAIADMVTQLASENGAIGVGKFTRQLAGATTFDMVIEAWINGLLSGPQTHAVNTLSNSLVATWMIPERLVTSAISKATGSNAVFAGEALQQTYGLVEGFKDGLKGFAKTMRTGEPIDVMDKVEIHKFRSITAENVRGTKWGRPLYNSLEEGGVGARSVDFMANATGFTARLPGRFLMAEDAFFKAIGYRMEVRAKAYASAIQDGVMESGGRRAVARRMNEILADPATKAPEVHAAAVEASRYQTFTKALGSAGQKGQGIISDIPALRLVVPFIRTPTNILKFGLERTPLAVASKSIRADIMAGGAPRDVALGKMAMGGMVMASVMTAACDGKVTGAGPSDPEMNALWRRQDNRKPYSVLIGDKYYAYNRLEPLGITMGLAADITEIIGQLNEFEAGELATATIVALAKNLTSKTWLGGVSKTLRVIDDPDRYVESYMNEFAASFIPTGVGQIEKHGLMIGDAVDAFSEVSPAIKAVKALTPQEKWEKGVSALNIIEGHPEVSAVYGLIDTFHAKTPNYSRDLPAMKNVWGEKIVLQGGLGPDIMSPIYTSEKKESPIDKELLRLETPIRMPRKQITRNGVTIELNPLQYNRLLELLNNPSKKVPPLKEALAELVTNNAAYDNSFDFQKIARIKKVKESYTKAAINLLMKEDPDIIKGLEEQQIEMLIQ